MADKFETHAYWLGEYMRAEIARRPTIAERLYLLSHAISKAYAPIFENLVQTSRNISAVYGKQFKVHSRYTRAR